MTVVRLSEEDLHGLHQVQLAMLLELDRVCRLLGVGYQLGAGSLLGAVRHGGFIPWDDDVDVVMLRADYQRFLREAPAMLDRDLFLQNWRTDPHFKECFTKLRRNGSMFREEICQHSRHHHGIFIDIFPFDPVWPGSWVLRRVVGLLQRLAAYARAGLLGPEFPVWRRLLRAIAYRGLSPVPPSLWSAMQESVLCCLSLVPATQVVCLVNGSLRWTNLQAFVRPVAEFEQSLMLAFESRPFPVTVAYHAALTRLYGDYMRLPPPERRTPKHPVVEFWLPAARGDQPTSGRPAARREKTGATFSDLPPG